MNQSMIFGAITVATVSLAVIAYKFATPTAPDLDKAQPQVVINSDVPPARQRLGPSDSPPLKPTQPQPTPPVAPKPSSAIGSSAKSLATPQIFEAIDAAAITYDPAQLPRIQPYLSHPDPEVRAAALNGVVVLGDAAGAPLLRDAASRAANPEEAAHLRETADFLELPPIPMEQLKEMMARSRAKRAADAGAPPSTASPSSNRPMPNTERGPQIPK